ncbi:MAG: sigma-70 family RNA polymerase sigma factor [Oscillospiraceae bacterium]|nr:sigma-70 family RNA polymerase sigma factor [Oscillospiraceae bacterium]
MTAIELNDELVRAYAKKIMGFAYSKARDITLAEDLSQEILLALSGALRRHETIADLDGYVYTICCYTWSNFVRANKKYWRTGNLDALSELRGDTDIASDAEHADALGRLRREIARLSKLHREITLMFYFENVSGAAIAQKLGLPHSTVRWHLGEIRKKLKVGIEMAENLSYTPGKLREGLDGFTLPEHGLAGIGKDRLVDNIILACYGKPLTIEDISRTLGVAAAYLEYHIDELVYMDYLKIVEKNKYQTTFFIPRARHEVLASVYQHGALPPYAERVYAAFVERYERIRAIGFLGSDQDRDFVLWSLMLLTLNRLYYRSLTDVLERSGSRLAHDFYPHRKDGSQHWVCASLVEDDWFDTQTEFTPDEIAVYRRSAMGGVWQNGTDIGGGNRAFSVQLNGRAQIFADYKMEFVDLADIARIAEIIRSGETPNEHDKLIIASQVERGYVAVDNGVPHMLIPYFSVDEKRELNVILDEIADELGETTFTPYIEEWGRIFEPELPAFLSGDERQYNKIANFTAPVHTAMYLLEDNGLLRSPTDDEVKRLATVVWCEETGQQTPQ